MTPKIWVVKLPFGAKISQPSQTQQMWRVFMSLSAKMEVRGNYFGMFCVMSRYGWLDKDLAYACNRINF